MLTRWRWPGSLQRMVRPQLFATTSNVIQCLSGLFLRRREAAFPVFVRQCAPIACLRWVNLCILQAAVMLGSASQGAASPPSRVIENVGHRIANSRHAVFILSQSPDVRAGFQLHRNLSDGASEYAAARIRLAVHGQAIDPDSTKKRGDNAPDPRKNYRPMWIVIYVASVLGAFLMGWEAYNLWRALRSNDPSSATRPTGRLDCNSDAMAGFAAAHG